MYLSGLALEWLIHSVISVKTTLNEMRIFEALLYLIFKTERIAATLPPIVLLMLLVAMVVIVCVCMCRPNEKY